jgi:two-component system OmpR family response regulator
VVLAHGPAEHLRAAFLAGCADYLKEPWDPVELETRLLRVASISRTVAVSVAVGYELWGRTVHLPDGRTVGLSAHEAVVAGLLFGNLGEIVSRRTLAYALWGRQPTHPSRAVDMHVSALRRKLGRDLISCVRGQGYVVSVAHEQPEHP